MSDWQERMVRQVYRLEQCVDNLKLQWKRRFGWLEPVHILAYRGHGTPQEVYLKGRVLEDKGIQHTTHDPSLWHNVRKMYKRFASDEIPGVRLRARIHDAEQETITDEEGYFHVHLQPTSFLQSDLLWHDVTLELLDDVVPQQGPVSTTGRVLVPPPCGAFGVISDVDDTIIQTQATNLLTMAWLTLFNNAHTRTPFAGVAAFYRALQHGATDTPTQPLFYVSSSPWNLYDFLVDFMDVHHIPAGPLFLRDFGLDPDRLFTSSHQAHKRSQIEGLLQTYADLSFILIGDSGQQDPEIYGQVVQDFPGRIQAIYIRNVTSERRQADVQALADRVRAQGSEMLLVQDSAEAAEHAAARGFITALALADVRTATSASA